MEIKRFIGGMLEANCYIISENNKKDRRKASYHVSCYIIDPGYNPKKIIRYVEDAGLSVQGIILTHHHYDHSEGADKIRKELGCPVLIHRMDGDMYRDYADSFLEDGDVLMLGEDDQNSSGEKLKVIHTPGHTAGGICLYSSKSKVCFTGDTIFNVDLGRTDLEDGSEADMISSIRNVVNQWGNDITIYPGHGDPATMKTVRKINREFLEIVNG